MLSNPPHQAADAPESAHPVRASLSLESLDAETLWNALGAVERALPELLLCLKPVLARLGDVMPDEQGEGQGEGARKAVDDYLAILDDIQYVLRQATFYLHATKTSPSTLRPPPPSSIPTPFASALPAASPLSQGDPPPAAAAGGEEDTAPDLGLYASRIEARTLESMAGIIRDLRRTMRVEKGAKGSDRRFGVDSAPGRSGETDGDAMSIDQR